MTLLVEPANDPGDLDGLERELKAAVAAPAAKSDTSADVKDDADSQPQIPEKYRGKSVEEIIEMHKNLESAYGRMANDLGQQRKLSDQLIQMELKRSDDLSRNTAHEEKDEPIQLTAAEILENPTAALERYYEARAAREQSEVQQRLAEMEGALARDRFQAKHPDVEQIGNDPAFVEWLQASPIRQRAAQAALNGDWQTADDLVTEFKANRKAPQKSESRVDEGVEAARKAGLESSGNAEGSSAASGKVYRRADLIRLKLEKPHVYESDDFQREILKAYAEGRVK